MVEVENHVHGNGNGCADRYLDSVCVHSPTIRRTLKRHSDKTLSNYLSHILPNATLSVQSRDDFLDAVHQYAASLLGEKIAGETVRQLAACPTVLTANHHGVDYFSQSVQGSLIFSLHKKPGTNHMATVPVLACGNIPLNNLTYPRGVLLYHSNRSDWHDMPIRLPIFPDRLKRKMVSVVTGVDDVMIRGAENRLNKLVQENRISSKLSSPLQDIFREDYRCSYVMPLYHYSGQAVVLNNRVWKRLFSDDCVAPEMVYLELEKLTNMLLQRDLHNSNSLAHCVMFDPLLREALFEQLDGVRACWKIDGLAMRLCKDLLHESKPDAINGCGTIFFWGVNDRGDRVPLYLETSGRGHMILRGVDDLASMYELPYTPDAVLEALNNARLLPSLLTCFLVLTFARGVTCAGGYFQAEYLPAMQHGLVTALQKTPAYQDMANHVEGVKTCTYLSGMQAVMTRITENALIPAGPIEIIAGGGLTAQDIEQIGALTVKDAHIASLLETVPDVAPSTITAPDWKRQLAEDTGRLLLDKVVIK